jgi:hypothetical protein
MRIEAWEGSVASRLIRNRCRRGSIAKLDADKFSTSQM